MTRDDAYRPFAVLQDCDARVDVLAARHGPDDADVRRLRAQLAAFRAQATTLLVAVHALDAECGGFLRLVDATNRELDLLQGRYGPHPIIEAGRRDAEALRAELVARLPARVH